MIYKSLYAKDKKKIYYSQLNNACEAMFKKLDAEELRALRMILSPEWYSKVEKVIRPYLESCMIASAVIGCAATGHDVELWDGVQPEDYLMNWVNNPHNYDLLRSIRRDTDPEVWMCNRIPQYIPVAVREIFGADSLFVSGVKDQVSSILKEQGAIQVCYRDPGHAVLVVEYDTDTNTVVVVDPVKGFGLKYDLDEMDIHDWGIVYFVKE